MRHLTVTDSEIIESIGYEVQAVLKSGATGALEVVFKSSPDVVYRYDNVVSGTFLQLIMADSIGEEFHRAFRKTKYPFTKSQRQPTLKK